MDIRGWSITNLHQGDVKITEDLEVDGDITADGFTVASITTDDLITDKIQTKTPGGDLSFQDSAGVQAARLLDGAVMSIGTGGTEYALPVADGTASQILSTDGKGVVSFTNASVGQARVIQNKFTCDLARDFYTLGVYQSVNLSGTGSTTVLSASEFIDGSSFRVNLSGNWRIDSTGAATALGTFRFRIGATTFTSDAIIVSTVSQIRDREGDFNIVWTITRVGGNMYIMLDGITTLINSGADQPAFAIQMASTVPVQLTLPSFPFDINVDWKDSSVGGGSCWPQAATYYIDYMNPDTEILATSTPGGTTDHLALSNLTSGDAGHAQFAQLNGRSGGQHILGGTIATEKLQLQGNSADPTDAVEILSNLDVKAEDTVITDASGTEHIATFSASTSSGIIQFSKDLDMSNQRVIDLSAPTAAAHAATKGYVDTATGLNLPLTGGTMSGAINMGNQLITDLATPTATAHATTKGYVDTATGLNLPLTGGTLTGALDMKSNQIDDVGSSTDTSSFYESLSESKDWTGPWTVEPQAKDVELIRIGKFVCLTVGVLQSAANTADVITLVTALPIRFRPLRLTYQYVTVIDNSSNTLGTVTVDSAGDVTVGVGESPGNFTNSGNAGWRGFSVTWMTA